MDVTEVYDLERSLSSGYKRFGIGRSRLREWNLECVNSRWLAESYKGITELLRGLTKRID
jgi:hypothetical protein